MKKKKSGLFGKIENRDEALKTIHDGSMAFFFVAALQAGLGYFLAPSMIIDAVLYAVLGWILLKWKSRVAAVLLLLLGGLALVMTGLNKFGVTHEGGSNLFLALVIFWTAIRSVEASFKLHGKYAVETVLGAIRGRNCSLPAKPGVSGKRTGGPPR